MSVAFQHSRRFLPHKLPQGFRLQDNRPRSPAKHPLQQVLGLAHAEGHKPAVCPVLHCLQIKVTRFSRLARDLRLNQNAHAYMAVILRLVLVQIENPQALRTGHPER